MAPVASVFAWHAPIQPSLAQLAKSPTPVLVLQPHAVVSAFACSVDGEVRLDEPELLVRLPGHLGEDVGGVRVTERGGGGPSSRALSERAALDIDDATAERDRDRVGAVRRVELAKGALQVGLHGLLGYRELPGDLLVLAAVRHQAQDLNLPLAELTKGMSGARPCHSSAASSDSSPSVSPSSRCLAYDRRMYGKAN